MNQIRRRRPFGNIDCQSLLALGVKYYGWIRLKNTRSKKFTVLMRGHMYIFKNENSTNHLKDLSFSLYGYTRVELPILTEKETIWVIKLVHHESKTKIFKTSSEIELNEWTERLQEGISFVNNVQNRQSYANWPDQINEPDIYDRRYQDGRHMYEGLSIYNGQSLPQSYSQMSIGASNTSLYEDVNSQRHIPTERPPILPPRPKKENEMTNSYLDKVVFDDKKSTCNTNIIEIQTDQSESSSELDDDSFESELCYKNTSDNRNCYSNMPG
ncbi:uncharacterized protein LOC127714640 isoform X2 [Mytilus californianus]|uniref:uncharacterized protein LOC127714640 isoform X2 n=1 Tax=Mytilus californianus TaxID=6549 RepID=UPI0022463A74|nr:uncharacterized protein LOC127714640 isoform X2 [Mytilus californianus]